MNTFNTLAQFKCLEQNPPALSTVEMQQLKANQLKYMCPNVEDIGKDGFHEFQLLTKQEQAVAFMIRGEQFCLEEKKSYNGAAVLEFNMYVSTDVKEALYNLASNMQTFINAKYGQAAEIKTGIFKDRIYMPWAKTYGKYDKVEIEALKQTFACHPDENLEELQKLLVAQPARVRVVVKSWIRTIGGKIQAGFKLNVQKIILE